MGPWPRTKTSSCHHCWLPMESGLLTLNLLCQDLLSHYQLTYHFWQVSSSLHLITGNFVRGVSFCGLTHNSLSWGVPSSSIQHWTSSLISRKVLVGWCQSSTWYLFGAGDLPSSPETGLLGACPCPWPLLHPGAPPMLDVAWRHGRTHKLIHDPSVFF